MDKRVCDQLSDILRTPVCLQLVSPLYVGPVPRWLKALSMCWLMDAETVIHDRTNEPVLTTARTWGGSRRLDGSYMTGRTWHYHGMSHKATRTRTSVLQWFWRNHISDKNDRRGNKPPSVVTVPKTAFSYAMTVMDKVGGWNEEKWVGSKFAACMWMHTKAVPCDGRDLRQMLRIITECVSWACKDFMWEHVCVTEPTFSGRENDILKALNHDLDVPCRLQWEPLWFSASSRFNRKFANDWTKNRKVSRNSEHGD